MRVAVLGAGGIALGSAAYLQQQGHEPVVWSPSGKSTAAIADGTPVDVEGVITGKVVLPVAATCQEALDGAAVALVAVPGNGHRAVMDQAAAHLKSGQTVVISSHCSLSAVYLSKLLAERGVDVPIAAWGTTAVMGRRTGATGLQVSTLRKRLDVATLPVASEDAGFEVCQALFGDRFEKRADVLAIALSNLNPPLHLANALCNLTRIERAELWYNYDGMSETVGRLSEDLDTERLAVATAYGLSVRTVFEHFQLSHGLPPGSVAELAAAVHAKRHGPPGPTALSTRYITEDVPFGLVPTVAIGKVAGVPLPLHEAGIAIISSLYGRDFPSENDILPELELLGLAPEELHRLCRDGWGAR